MTMHLVGPYLTTTGKRKGKQKFRNSAEAQKARQLAAEWDELKQKWGVTDPKSKRKNNTVVTLPTQPKPCYRDTGPRPQSLNSWPHGPVSSKPSPKYTGNKIIGIGTMHKSNAVPIFNDEQAVDIAKMRR